MTTDPIANLLAIIRNGYLANKVEVSAPYSKLKEGVVRVLQQYEYISSYSISGEGKTKKLEIELRYDSDAQPVIRSIRRVSKPSLRRYVKSRDIRPVQNGYGISILSTSQGLMSGYEAKEKQLGGEIIATVW